MSRFRTGFVASATAIAVAFSGTTVASAQTPSTESASTSATPSIPATTPSNTATPDKAKTDQEKPKKDASSMTPAEIRDWIAVFTAVISALGTLLSFLSKYFNMPF